jgi:cytochrome c biogenesis protein CcmG, thiol:disulfide interchange protein DsbE
MGVMHDFSLSRCRNALRHLAFCLCLLWGSFIRADTPLDLNAFHGRVVYLDFWASWCGPCRQSFPWMEILKDTYGPQGLEIVAVNLDSDRADADRFLHQFHPTFDLRFDPKGELAALYKVQGMPSSVLIDRHGATRFTHVGFLPADARVYEAQVRELLAEK